MEGVYMKDENSEEKIVKTPKTKVYIIIIVILALMVCGLGGYIVYEKAFKKEESKEVNDSSKDNKNATDKQTEEDTEKSINVEKDQTKVEDIITEDEARVFLNNLVSDSVVQDLLIAKTDEEIFISAIKHLAFNNKYTKDGNKFVFKKKIFKI